MEKLTAPDHALLLRNARHKVELPASAGAPFIIDGQPCSREEFELIAELCDPAFPLF